MGRVFEIFFPVLGRGEIFIQNPAGDRGCNPLKRDVLTDTPKTVGI